MSDLQIYIAIYFFGLAAEVNDKCQNIPLLVFAGHNLSLLANRKLSGETDLILYAEQHVTMSHPR